MITIRFYKTTRTKDKTLHIETNGCIVNIQVGLRDSYGRAVTSVEVLCDQIPGDSWTVEGGPTRSASLRVVRVEGNVSA